MNWLGSHLFLIHTLEFYCFQFQESNSYVKPDTVFLSFFDWNDRLSYRSSGFKNQITFNDWHWLWLLMLTFFLSVNFLLHNSKLPNSRKTNLFFSSKNFTQTTDDKKTIWHATLVAITRKRQWLHNTCLSYCLYSSPLHRIFSDFIV